MKCEKNIVLYSTACLLALAGCATQGSSAPMSVMSIDQETHPMQLPIRVIIYFHGQASDSAPLAGAIAEACGCSPVFLRKHADDALIYQISLPQGKVLASFAERLIEKTELGVKLVEQDRLMMHQ